MVFRNTIVLIIFVSLSILLSSNIYCEETQNVELLWPFKDYHSISSNFGEYRPGHVHMGIDIRIGGRIGVPALAVADGFVSRIKVKPNGYGKALYLTLSDGRTAVYAHLDSFTPEVQRYVEDSQWQNHEFSQDLFPIKDAFAFKRGEIAAYAGRSGTTSPHLHFEIRTEKNDAQNPFSQGLHIKDTKPPVLSSIAVIPLERNSEVDGDCKPVVYGVKSAADDNYTCDLCPKVYGSIGFALKYHDYTNEAPYSIAAYKLSLTFDNEEKFSSIYDECDYYSYLNVEVDRDPYLKRNGQGRFQRLFCNPGNNMPVYSGEGRLDTAKLTPGIHSVSITVSDFYGNKAKVDFEIEILAEPTIPQSALLDAFQSKSREKRDSDVSKPSYSIDFLKDWARIEIGNFSDSIYWLNGREYLLNFYKVNNETAGRMVFTPEVAGLNFLYSADYGVLESWHIAQITNKNGGIIQSPDKKMRIVFPPDGVYEDFYCSIQPVEIDELPKGFNYKSETAYRLSPQWIPLKRKASIYWDTKDTTGQTGVYYLDMREGPTFIGNELSGNGVIGECLNLETFFLAADTQSPVLNMLSPHPAKPVNRNTKTFKFELLDKLSGIDFEKIEASVDGDWALPEYDPPRDILFVHIREPLSSDKHEIKVSAPDKSGNTAERSWRLTVK